jgi:hypothetical protein
MSLAVRFVFGAALLLTGATSAMAQYATPYAANQPPQAAQPLQSGAPGAPVPYASGAIIQQPAPHRSTVVNKDDPHGGHDPNSPQGIQSFWDTQSNLY